MNDELSSMWKDCDHLFYNLATHIKEMQNAHRHFIRDPIRTRPLGKAKCR